MPVWVDGATYAPPYTPPPHCLAAKWAPIGGTPAVPVYSFKPMKEKFQRALSPLLSSLEADDAVYIAL